jgi:pentatricopeptide repeat protein
VEAEMAAIVPGTLQLNNFSCNRSLARYVRAGQYEKTLELFQQMQQDCMIPDSFTFVPVLNACATLQLLEDGRHVHKQIIESGCESDIFVGNSLIDMYAKCGGMEKAWSVFVRMPTHTVVSWTTTILGNVKCGDGHKALELFQQMKLEAVEPNSVTFVGVLNACASIGTLEEGRHLHQQILESNCESDIFVGNSLIDMYSKCGSMEEAWRIFNKMPTRNVVTWTAMFWDM